LVPRGQAATAGSLLKMAYQFTPIPEGLRGALVSRSDRAKCFSVEYEVAGGQTRSLDLCCLTEAHLATWQRGILPADCIRGLHWQIRPELTATVECRGATGAELRGPTGLTALLSEVHLLRARQPLHKTSGDLADSSYSLRDEGDASGRSSKANSPEQAEEGLRKFQAVVRGSQTRMLLRDLSSPLADSFGEEKRNETPLSRREEVARGEPSEQLLVTVLSGRRLPHPPWHDVADTRLVCQVTLGRRTSVSEPLPFAEAPRWEWEFLAPCPDQSHARIIVNVFWERDRGHRQEPERVGSRCPLL
jgi:hypothetical protein